MGHYTWSDIVENVAYLGKLTEIEKLYQGDDAVIEEALCAGVGLLANINGWDYFADQDKVGKKKALLANLVKKGDRQVYLLNTSQYCHVGEFEWVVFSKDRAAVEEFLKDFGKTAVIEDVDSVCQSG